MDAVGGAGARDFTEGIIAQKHISDTGRSLPILPIGIRRLEKVWIIGVP